MGLYGDLLQRLQDVNTYGGGSGVFLLRQKVFDAIDSGADSGDQTLISLRRDIWEREAGWRNVEDYNALSRLFETYCEATFYLAAKKRIDLEGIARTSMSTPDFRTTQIPHVQFEVKTLDIADPIATYPELMADGLEASIKANDEAKRKGIGFAENVISPHGPTATLCDAIEQTMRKLGGNVKADQYKSAPTFLVVNLGRLSVTVEPEQLNPTHTVPDDETFDDEPAKLSGQLWTIASHNPGDPFTWLDPDLRGQSRAVERAGLLRDYPFIQGLVFTKEPWGAFEREADWRDAYPFLGVWNEDCELAWGPDTHKEAQRALNTLCSHVVSTR